jgi:hypothetical protein
MPPEPTVWDYVKSVLMPWQGHPPEIPAVEHPTDPVNLDGVPAAEMTAQRFPLQVLGAFLVAVLAQWTFEPSLGATRSWQIGSIGYGLAIVWLVVIAWRGKWPLAASHPDETRDDPETVSGLPMLLAMALTVGAFFLMRGNRFTLLNVILWLAALAAMLWALWLPDTSLPLRQRWHSFKAFIRQPRWKIPITRWTLVCLLVIGVVLFFRFFRLNSVPPEMISDHAEKLLDVWDVLGGKTSIFFVRNTGREPLQFYLTAAMSKIFGTGISFLSLKLGTAFAGLLMLVYIYLLGKEIGNRNVGLFALFLSGTAYWTNVITRIALRFSLYPLFVAPVMYHLLRGLRTRDRNHFLLAGVYLGIGLHGYSPFRVVPLLVLLAVGLYLIHAQSRGGRVQIVWQLTTLIVIAGIVFLPLLSFVSNPLNMDWFFIRTATRLTNLEQPIEGNPFVIFLNNFWKAWIMFGWDNNHIWAHSVPNRPALDVISAVLFYLGIVLLLVRYLRHRHWMDILLPLSVIVLMLSSTLSLAFPGENPNLNRTAGALVPVFIIAALTLDGLVTALEKWRRYWGWGLAILLLFFVGRQNYDLIFNQYQAIYTAYSINSSEMGELIQDFADSVGRYDTAWVIGYPYWVDTRLVGINAGQPGHDYALAYEDIGRTLAIPDYKLFIFHPQDSVTQQLLTRLYPQGSLRPYQSAVGKNFFMFIVPGTELPSLPDSSTDGLFAP